MNNPDEEIEEMIANDDIRQTYFLSFLHFKYWLQFRVLFRRVAKRRRHIGVKKRSKKDDLVFKIFAKLSTLTSWIPCDLY